MRKVFSLTICALLLAGCVGASLSQSMMITEDTALITIVAKGRETRQTLVDATLGEAATVTRAHGFRYFVVLEIEDTTQIFTRRLPGHTIPNQNTAARGYSSTNLSTSYLPGATFTTPDQEVKEVRPGLDVTIRMYRDGAIDPAGEGVWNSDHIPARSADAR